MSTISILSIHRPLVIVTKNERNQLIARKYWHVIPEENPYTREEEIWSSYCRFSKSHSFKEEDFQWNTKKRYNKENSTVALLQYDTVAGTVDIHRVANLSKIRTKENLPEPIDKYLEFMLNPEHHFSLHQSQALCQQLRSWITPEQLNQFLALYPNAAKEYDKDSPDIIANQDNQDNYPTTVLDAYQLVRHEAPVNVQYEDPTLLFIENQPTNSHPLTIPNLRPTNFRTGRPMTVGTYSVSLHVTPEGKHNSRREVFYANDIPMSPLKSTVAILYADTNPKSATFNQPVIKSINIANSTQEEINQFLKDYGPNMNEQQRAQFATVPRAHPHQPATGEPLAMSEQPYFCAECGADFPPTRSTSRFCCEACRVTFYSKGRRKLQPTPSQHQPQPQHQPTQPSADAVSREEFQALSAQMAQILHLLTTPKG